MRCKACNNKLTTIHWDAEKQEHEAYCYECRTSIGMAPNKSELSDEGFYPLGDEFDELD